MKFTMLWKDTEESRKIVADWVKEGPGPDGIALIEAYPGFVTNKVTGAIENAALGLKCKGPILSYLKFKRGFKGTTWLGWGKCPK